MSNQLQHSLPKVMGAVLVTMAAVSIYALSALFVHADAAPTVTATIQNASNVSVTSATLGSFVHNVAQVASSTGSTTPSGTVTFTQYTTSTSCSGASTTQSVALVNGYATSSAVATPATGLSYKVHYNGDANYPAADGVCQSLAVTSTSAAINTALSSGSVVAGASVYDTATLSNVTSAATGSAAYSVYANNSCSTLYQTAGTKTVTNAAVPNSDSIQFNTPGTYYWQVVYSGDQNNTAATSSCGSEILVVSATTTPPPAPGTANISGEKFNDLNKNGIKDAGEPGLSGWTIDLFGTSKVRAWSWMHGKKFGMWKNQVVTAKATTDANGNYSFSNIAPGQYTLREEQQKGWRQTTKNPAMITLATSTTITNIDFGNTLISTSTRGHGRGGHDGNDNDNDDNGHDGNNGNSGGVVLGTSTPFGENFPFKKGFWDNFFKKMPFHRGN